jgi:5-hydroxyisourate hydrolase-like protein (transthyretin family)
VPLCRAEASRRQSQITSAVSLGERTFACMVRLLEPVRFVLSKTISHYHIPYLIVLSRPLLRFFGDR